MAALLALVLIVGGVSMTAMAAANADTTASESASAADPAKGSKKVSATHVSKTAVAATVLGKTEDELKAALKDNSLGQLLIAAGKLDAFKTAYLAEYRTKLDAAVTAGTLTGAQADEKYTAKKSAVDAWDGSADLTTKPTKGNKTTGTSKGTKGVHIDAIDLAADILGKTKDEVKDAVKDGKIGDLLIAAGKVDAFKAAYLTESKTKLDAAVTAGTLTQAQADEKYAAEKAKMAAYDGTTHLCEGKDHSKSGSKNSGVAA
jgi:hypothetical protein